MTDLDTIRKRHENHEPDGWPIDRCSYCDETWPCDTAVVLAALSVVNDRADKLAGVLAELEGALRGLADAYGWDRLNQEGVVMDALEAYWGARRGR